jgi:hypothetical protein
VSYDLQLIASFTKSTRDVVTTHEGGDHEPTEP